MINSLTEAYEAGVDAAIRLQNGDGYWEGSPDTNVSVDAEETFTRYILGLGLSPANGDWIRSQQGDDGGWSVYRGGPSSLSDSIEAYVALRLQGDDPADAHMRKASGFIRSGGGLTSARNFTKFWLCLLGEMSWETLPSLPIECLLLPRWSPGSIYRFAAWARQTMPPVLILYALRPSVQLPFSLNELWVRDSAPHGLNGIWRWADEAFRYYDRAPFAGLRERALTVAEDWILGHQDGDGLWGGIHTPTFFSLVALKALGYDVRSEPMRRGIQGLNRAVVDDDRGRRYRCTTSDVWDTSLLVQAICSGPRGLWPRKALSDAVDHLLAAQTTRYGDWAVCGPKVSGGWPMGHANSWYPDADSTAETIEALNAYDVGNEALRRPLKRAANWLVRMQSRSGGWSAFDRSQGGTFWNSLPIADFGEMVDRPSTDVTAHAVTSLTAIGWPDPTPIAKASRWLLAAQEPDGSWHGRWGVSYLYGTSAALAALRSCGHGWRESTGRGERWMLHIQNPDGSWGEDPRADIDRSWRGKGPATVSQTAWGVLGLLDGIEAQCCSAVDRGVRWLIEQQSSDGRWSDEWHVGTGFYSEFYFRYDLYPQTFAIKAIGRHLSKLVSEANQRNLGGVANESTARPRRL